MKNCLLPQCRFFFSIHLSKLQPLTLLVCFSIPGFADLTFPVVCLVQVNKKGTLMLSGLLGIGVDDNILWPDIPYVTDQHGSKLKKERKKGISLLRIYSIGL